MRTPTLTALAAATLLALTAGPATANEQLQTEVPNGARLGCIGCHPFGSALNAFSIQMKENGNDWSALCPLDADDDGYSNGAELGDPDCVWTVGAAPASPDVTYPADPASYPQPDAPGDDGGPGLPDDGVRRDDAGRPLDDAGNPVGDAAVDPPPTGDAVENLDDGCAASPAAPATPAAALALIALVARRRRR